MLGCRKVMESAGAGGFKTAKKLGFPHLPYPVSLRHLNWQKGVRKQTRAPNLVVLGFRV